MGCGNLLEADTSASKSQKRAVLLLLAEYTKVLPGELPANTAEAIHERPKSMAATAAMQTVCQTQGMTPWGTSQSQRFKAVKATMGRFAGEQKTSS